MTAAAPKSLLALAPAALAAFLSGCAAPQSPPAVAAHAQAAPAPVSAAPAETPAQRGEYLVLIGGCDDCHTPGGMSGQPDMTRRFAGSEIPWGGPWGVTYGRNLTSDPETGLGRWTEEQIFHALRHGVRPDGSVLMPPMPWQRFAIVKEDDVRAIAAYLKSLPPVRHAVPPALPPGSPLPPGTVTMPPPPPWDSPVAVSAGQ